MDFHRVPGDCWALRQVGGPHMSRHQMGEHPPFRRCERSIKVGWPGVQTPHRGEEHNLKPWQPPEIEPCLQHLLMVLRTKPFDTGAAPTVLVSGGRGGCKKFCRGGTGRLGWRGRPTTGALSWHSVGEAGPTLWVRAAGRPRLWRASPCGAQQCGCSSAHGVSQKKKRPDRWTSWQ